MRNLSRRLFVLLLIAISDLSHFNVFAQGTAFTYQGHLNAGGSPANGNYDLVFTLFPTNLPTAVPLAGPVTNTAVPVTNGLFTTLVDFGYAYAGQSNWLQIAVSTNGANNFIALSPLQQLTPVPYAMTAYNVSGVVSSGNVAGVYGNAVAFNNANNSFNGTYAGNGGGLTNVNASQLGSISQPAVVFGAVSNGSDIISIAPVLTNQWAGGPFWSSNSFAPAPWQWFQVAPGTNISGLSSGSLGSNNIIFVKSNKAYTPLANAGTQSFYSLAGASPGVDAGNETAMCSYWFNTYGNTFTVGFAGQGGIFKVLENGVDNGLDVRLPVDGNNYIYQVTFATVAWRQVEIELDGSLRNALQGIMIPATNVFSEYVPPAGLQRFIIIGDSYSEEQIPNYTDTNGNGTVGLGYGHQLSLLLPSLDVWSLGSGGTGYSNTDGGLRPNFPSRITVDVISNQPAYVLLAGGINDVNYPTNNMFSYATNTIGQIVAGSPRTTLFMVGPWCPNGGNATNQSSSWRVLGNILSNAMALYGIGNNYVDNMAGPDGPWITGQYNVPGSGNAPIYISSDGTHPTPLGHQYLALKLDEELTKRGLSAQSSGATGMTGSVNIQTNSAGHHGISLNVTNGLIIGVKTY